MTWPLVSLRDALASARVFVDGDWVESKDQDPEGDVRLVQLADVGDGEYNDKSDRYLTSAKARALRCTFLEPGDILVARMPDPLGRACIFPGDSKPCVTVVDVCVIRPDLQKHDARWLMHCLNAPSCRNQIAGYATGTTRSRISRGNLGKIRIPSLPLAEQRRITKCLDNAYALRAKRRAALAQLRILAQSIFLDMFGHPAIILERWPTKRLGDLLDFLTSGSRGWAEHYADTGDLFLRIQNVQHDRLALDDVAYVAAPETAEARRTRVEPGDVLLSITADLGRTAVVPHGLGSAFINQHLSILRTRAIVPRFLSAYLSSPAGQRQILGRNKQGVKAGLNFDDIRSITVPLPPSGTQKEFLNRATSVETLIATSREALAQVEALFASLHYRAFRGEL